MRARPGSRMRRRRRGERGFTLIEVMISILLIAIAVIGLVALFMVQSRGASTSRHTTEAAVLAEDKMEYLRTQVAPGAGSETTLDSLGQSGTGIFGRTWTSASGTSYIDYSVVVSWIEDGVNRTVTLRSRRGL